MSTLHDARNTKQRGAINRVFARSPRRVFSATEIYTEARKDISGLGIATVYRNLRNLVEAKTIRVVHIPGEVDHYAASISVDENRLPIILTCSQCKAVTRADLSEALEDSIMKALAGGLGSPMLPGETQIFSSWVCGDH